MPLPEALRTLVTWVADGVGWIAPPDGTNGAASMVLDEGEEVVLVDAGLPVELREKFAPHVDVCILSHCHLPHATGAADFREVWAPSEEAAALEGEEQFLSTYDVGRRDRPLVLSAIQKAGYRPARVHKRYQPGGLLALSNSDWRFVAMPGHSQGLVGMLDAKRHIFFSSSLDGHSPPWYGFPASDPAELERTAEALAAIPVAILLGSRAPPRRRGIKPLFRGMAETVRERDMAVLAALQGPRSLDELADHGLLGGRPSTPLARYHERIMVEKHLARLLERDFVAARQDGRYEKL